MYFLYWCFLVFWGRHGMDLVWFWKFPKVYVAMAFKYVFNIKCGKLSYTILHLIILHSLLVKGQKWSQEKEKKMIICSFPFILWKKHKNLYIFLPSCFSGCRCQNLSSRFILNPWLEGFTSRSLIFCGYNFFINTLTRFMAHYIILDVLISKN